MTISLLRRKLQSIVRLACSTLEQERVKLRDLSQILVAHPVILPLCFITGAMECTKNKALRRGLPKNAKVELDEAMRADMRWWKMSLMVVLF